MPAHMCRGYKSPVGGGALWVGQEGYASYRSPYVGQVELESVFL